MVWEKRVFLNLHSQNPRAYALWSLRCAPWWGSRALRQEPSGDVLSWLIRAPSHANRPTNRPGGTPDGDCSVARAGLRSLIVTGTRPYQPPDSRNDLRLELTKTTVAPEANPPREEKGARRRPSRGPAMLHPPRRRECDKRSPGEYRAAGRSRQPLRLPPRA